MSGAVAGLKERGNAAFKAGRFSEAVRLFSEALAIDPNNHILYSNRSAAFASLHRYEEALVDGQTAVSIKPDWAKAYGRIATAYFALESWDDAVVAYMQGLELDPYNASMRSGLRDALAQSKGNPTEAPWVPHAQMAPQGPVPAGPYRQGPPQGPPQGPLMGYYMAPPVAPAPPMPPPVPSANAWFPSKPHPSQTYNQVPAGPPAGPMHMRGPSMGPGSPSGAGPSGTWQAGGSSSNGSMFYAHEPIHLWSSDQVGVFLQHLELHTLVSSFRENGVNGRDLLMLSDNDFVHDLGVTRLQLRKLRSGIAELRNAVPHLAGGPSQGPSPMQGPRGPMQPSPPRKTAMPENGGSWFDMYVNGNPYVQQFSKKRSPSMGPQGPPEGPSGSGAWGPSGSTSSAGPSATIYDMSDDAGPSTGSPMGMGPLEDAEETTKEPQPEARSPRGYDTTYSFKPSEQFKLRPSPTHKTMPSSRPMMDSPLAEGRWAQPMPPQMPPQMSPQMPPHMAPQPQYGYYDYGAGPSQGPSQGPMAMAAQYSAQSEEDLAGGLMGQGPVRAEGVYRDGMMFQGQPTSDGYLMDERAFMRVAPPPPGYDAYGRPLGGPLKGYYTQGGTHVRIPSIDGMYGDRNSPRRGATVFRELPAMVQPPPVVKVHPQLKAEANWVQRLIQNLLAPRVWEGNDGALKEMNTQRHIVKLKTAMAQAVAVGFFELSQRGSGMTAWTSSRGFVLCNLGWREGQPVWTAPCFYEIKAGIDRSVMQQGLSDITCCLIINSPEALKKMARGRPVLGIDIPMKPGFSEGPYGEGESDIADPKTAEMVVFSVRRGQAMELNLAGGRIIGTEDNFTYFGRGVTPERILSGKVPQPEEFMSAYKTITSLTVGGATLLSFMQNQQAGMGAGMA